MGAIGATNLAGARVFANVTFESPLRNAGLLKCIGMSFYDDLVEPEAIESAAHFAELVQVPADRVEFEQGLEVRRRRVETRRPLPRDLGN